MLEGRRAEKILSVGDIRDQKKNPKQNTVVQAYQSREEKDREEPESLNHLSCFINHFVFAFSFSQPLLLKN